MAERGTFLDGIRVLDLTGDGRMLCGKIGGDLGADVIQVESDETQDFTQGGYIIKETWKK